jgi:hypothetical protein
VKLAIRAGAKLQTQLDADTTHVIAAYVVHAAGAAAAC